MAEQSDPPVQKMKIESWGKSPERLAEIKDLDIRDDDLVLCSYPKSGSHWVKYIVCLLLNDGDTSAFKDQDEYFPFIDAGMPVDGEISDGMEIFKMHPAPRLCLTHLLRENLPRMATEGGKGRIIYIMRNPKDVCVSSFNYVIQLLQKLKNSSASSEQTNLVCKQVSYEHSLGVNVYAEKFVSDDGLFMGSWFDHVRDLYTFLVKRPNSLVLIYDEMIEDLTSSVRKISEFLGLSHGDKMISDISEKAQFSNMKKDVFEDADVKIAIAGVGKDLFFRAGRSGDWRNHLTPEVAEKFDEAVRSRMSDLELPFDFVGK